MHAAETPLDPTRLRDEQARSGEHIYAMWVHLAGLISWIAAVASHGIGFFVPSLVVAILWLARKSESPFIDDHGREALNFQISLVILGVIAVIVGAMLCGVGLVVTLPAVAVLSLAGTAMAAAAAHRGEYFRYPACIRFIGS